MRFTIITVARNAERYLQEALQSVASQDFSNYEHLFWDGGSTDRTLEIARQFPHLTLYEGRDRGIADAMNQAAARARGDYLLFLHGDDRFAHGRVLAFLDTAIKQYRRRWLYGRVGEMDEGGQILRWSAFAPFSHRKLRRYNLIPHPAACIERALFEEVGGYDPELRLAMDYDLWLRLAKIEEPLALGAVLAHFRIHEQSLSSALPLAVADEAYAVRNRYVETLWERFRSYRTWKRRRKKIQALI